MKGLMFTGTSYRDLLGFTQEARERAGLELRAVQRGEQPADWKPMPEVGAGAREIRIHVAGAWRVIYVAKFAEAVYVLHCFRKKNQHD